MTIDVLSDTESVPRGTCRVLYRIDEPTRTVTVPCVDCRRNVYRP